MTRSRYKSALLLLVAVFGGLAPGPTEAADAFYTRLFERGVRDLELGFADEAQNKLRTACFGFLEEPALLAEALMQLGRAQALSGNTADLTGTAERLAELEDRFGAYSNFEGDLKAVFENSLRSGLPEALLARIPLFSPLTIQAEPVPADPKPLTGKQRRKELERQLAADPGNGDALSELAQLHFASGKLKTAAAFLDHLLAIQPESQEALCLRADIAITRKECAPALAGLKPCEALTATDEAVALLLECLVSSERSAEAIALLETLPVDRRKARAITRVARKIPRSEEPTEAEPAKPIEEPAEKGILRPVGQEATSQPDVALREIRIGLALDGRMQRLRDEVARIRFREQLEEALQSAAELAEEYPESAKAQHLAAEIAYLSAKWRLVLDYFDRGGRPSAERPDLLFYLAVATYELGNAREAATILEPALPTLPRSPFVDAYIEKILQRPQS